ncbi:hypothetical protein [Erwinia sp. 9145]|uniref:DUF5862 family protein n=1 Tax=Erwinia sp. 9145 TaxID=1500895 RepID=UPI0005549EC0|nr:hypothetical protein [Erwinia sp. 9145]
MRDLSISELQYISGAGPITQPDFAYLDDLFLCMLDGMATGMAIGGKWGGAGGFIVGGISQLVGLIIPTIMGGALGLFSGLIIGKEATSQLLSDYRDKFGAGNVS